MHAACAHGGEPVHVHRQGTPSAHSHTLKEDIFLANGLYSLAVLRCFEYTEDSVWGVSFLSLSALRFSCRVVCRRNEGSVCSGRCGVIIKRRPCFSQGLRAAAFPSTRLSAPLRLCASRLSQRFCFRSSPPPPGDWRTMLVGVPADSLNHLKNGLLSHLLMSSLSRKAWCFRLGFVCLPPHERPLRESCPPPTSPRK